MCEHISKHAKAAEIACTCSFGNTIRNVSVRCLQHRVRRRVQRLFQDSHLQRNEGGRLTTRCHVGLPPVVIGLDVPPSVIVWPCSLFHQPPPSSHCSQICFISMQPGQHTILAPLLKCASFLVGYCCFRCFFFLRSSFEKHKGFDPFVLLRTHPALLAVFFPQISPPYCGPLAWRVKSLDCDNPKKA